MPNTTPHTFSHAAHALYALAYPETSKTAWQAPSRAQALEQYDWLCDHVESLSQAALTVRQLASGIRLLIAMLQTSPECDGFVGQGIVGLLSPLHEALEQLEKDVQATIAE